jgi:hypothetical protein
MLKKSLDIPEGSLCTKAVRNRFLYKIEYKVLKVFLFQFLSWLHWYLLAKRMNGLAQLQH